MHIKAQQLLLPDFGQRLGAVVSQQGDEVVGRVDTSQDFAASVLFQFGDQLDVRVYVVGIDLPVCPRFVA